MPETQNALHPRKSIALYASEKQGIAEGLASEWYAINDPKYYYYALRKRITTPIQYKTDSPSAKAGHIPPTREYMFALLEAKVEAAIKEEDANDRELPKSLVEYTVSLQSWDLDNSFSLVSEVIDAYRFRIKSVKREAPEKDFKGVCEQGAGVSRRQ